MNRSINPKSTYGVFAGFILIAALGVTIFSQTLGPRWWYRVQQDRLFSDRYNLAREMYPEIDENSSLEDHITFQELMIASGKRHHAERLYADKVKMHPSSAALQALFARVTPIPFRKQNLLEKAQSLDADDPAVRFVTTEDYLNRGLLLKTMEFLKRETFQSWLRWSLEAQTAWALGDSERASAAFQKALEDKNLPRASLSAQILPPSLLSVHLSYCQFLSEQKENMSERNPLPAFQSKRSASLPLVYAYDVLISGKSVKELLPSIPDSVTKNPDALTVLARAAVKLKDYEIARTLLSDSLRINPHQPNALVCQGVIALAEGDDRKADELFSSELDDRSRRVDRNFHCRMGRLLALENQSDYALKHYVKALGTVPDNLILLKKLARSYKEKHEYEKTIETLNRAYALKPKDAETLNGLADIYSILHDREHLIQTISELLDLDIHDRLIRKRLADLYIDKGEINRAIGLYDSYIQRFPDKSVWCYAEIVRIHLKNGNLDKADRILQNALKTITDDNEKKELMKALNDVEIAKTGSSKN